MSATATDLAPDRRGRADWLWHRQLDTYPGTGPRVLYLAITVLATVTLYYELYVGGAVATLLLTNLHMSFAFYVVILAFGNLIGAFGSLFAGLADRWGRANLVVGGLLLTGLLTAFIIPAVTNKSLGFGGVRFPRNVGRWPGSGGHGPTSGGGCAARVPASAP